MVISIIEQIKQLEKVLIPRYEITKRHFEVGDTVVSLVTGDEIPDLAEVVVEAGSEIFKTVEEARMAMHFNETLSGLYRIRNMLEEEGFDVNSNILNGEDCGGETQTIPK
ncbi:MAG: hypothetical protein ACLFUH_11455 [Bacteroidales bacterium]